MDISSTELSSRDRTAETLFADYAPKIAAFCRDIANDSYEFNSLPGLRRNLDVMKEFRHAYNKAHDSEEIKDDKGLPEFFDAMHMIEHGMWAVYASKRLKAVAGDELKLLYIDDSGMVGYETLIKDTLKRNTARLRFAQEKQGGHDAHEALPEKSSEESPKHATQPRENILYSTRTSLSEQLDSIIDRWHNPLHDASSEVVAFQYMDGIEGRSYHRDRLDDAVLEKSREAILRDIRSIYKTLLDKVSPRLSFFFEGNEKNVEACRARYFKENNTSKAEISEWLQTHLKPWRPAQILEETITSYGDILSGVKNESSLNKISDSNTSLLIYMEAAWALMEHIEGIHELIKHDMEGEVYGDDYQAIGKEIFTSGAFANYLVDKAIMQIVDMK